MSYTLLSESHPVARKKHRCIWCGESIQPGEKYRRERGVFDGNMQDFAWHPECAQAQLDEIRATGEPEFFAYENERPVAGVETPSNDQGENHG